MDETAMTKTSLRAMEYIKGKDYINFRYLIPDKLLSYFPDEKAHPAVDFASDLL
jgi:hypothetical protein